MGSGCYISTLSYRLVKDPRESYQNYPNHSTTVFVPLCSWRKFVETKYWCTRSSFDQYIISEECTIKRSAPYGMKNESSFPSSHLQSYVALWSDLLQDKNIMTALKWQPWSSVCIRCFTALGEACEWWFTMVLWCTQSKSREERLDSVTSALLCCSKLLFSSYVPCYILCF